MKQIDYQMLIKRKDCEVSWVEDNSAIVKDNVTIAQHAKATVEKYNKRGGNAIFVVARQLPAKYIIKIYEN